jgi:endoribonuclease Dicer
LIVKELNAQFFANMVLEQHLLSAVFAPSATFETDYERLELLGDSFLKYFSSVYVFVFNPALNEGALHKTRQHIISNKVLTQCGLSIGLPSYIQGKTFSYKLWQPPNFTVQDISLQHLGRSNDLTSSSGNDGMAIDTKIQGPVNDTNASTIHSTSQSKTKHKASDDNITQWLGDKTIADVAEAIIGAAYLSGGRNVALRVIKALRLPVADVEQWEDFRRKALAPPSNVTARLRGGTLSAVEEIIGASFKYPHLLSQALTHGSIHGYDNTCYERLEFLGDAVLDFLVVRHVFNRDDHMSPGAMTLLKSAMVSNSALAAVCVRTGLHAYLLYESYALGNSIQSYAEQLETRRQEEHQKAVRDGRPPGQYWLDMEPPKILSDVVESIIGALYISDGFTSDGVEFMFKKILEPFYDQHVTVKTLSHHPTKILFEIMQTQGCQQFSIEKEKLGETLGTRCDVIVHDIILASATESTGYIAGRMASTAALDALEGDPSFMAHNCSCRNRTQMGKKDYKNRLEKMLADLEEGQNVTTEEDHNGRMEVDQQLVKRSSV